MNHHSCKDDLYIETGPGSRRRTSNSKERLVSESDKHVHAQTVLFCYEPGIAFTEPDKLAENRTVFEYVITEPKFKGRWLHLDRHSTSG